MKDKKPISPITVILLTGGLVLLIVVAMLVTYLVVTTNNNVIPQPDNDPSAELAMPKGPTDTPRFAIFSESDGEFRTLQISVSDSTFDAVSHVAELVDSTNYSNQYVVDIDNLVVYQAIDHSSKSNMRNTYGPASIYCELPDGKFISGYAEKIYAHEQNGAMEFILDNTWYYTSAKRVTVTIDKD